MNAALQRCLGLEPHRIDVAAWFAACPKPRRRIHFWPVTKSGNNIMISSFFGSDTCAFCGRKCRADGRSRAAVCGHCRADEVKATDAAMRRLSSVEKESMEKASRCRKCNRCFEDASTFGQLRLRSTAGGILPASGVVTPLGNCSCIDCPTTFERHRLREAQLEASALCEALGLL